MTILLDSSGTKLMTSALIRYFDLQVDTRRSGTLRKKGLLGLVKEDLLEDFLTDTFRLPVPDPMMDGRPVRDGNYEFYITLKDDLSEIFRKDTAKE